MEVVRIVEYQSDFLFSYRATRHEDRATQLESLFALTKPKNRYPQWHPLIAKPFQHHPPHPHARFRPSSGRNVFYGSFIEETALYEHAFHFMRQRMHLNVDTETGTRTLFFVETNNTNSIQIRTDNNFLAIIDKNNYAASHQFIIKNPHATFLIYPSCRDPLQRDNAAILDIQLLDKNPKWESCINFFYDNQKKQITWLDYSLHIQWAQVS